jgi:hypothetical protein
MNASRNPPSWLASLGHVYSRPRYPKRYPTEMPDSSTVVAERFDRILAEMRAKEIPRPDGFADNDRAIYYIVSTRCEIDMNGFDSVFDQLLTEPELEFLVACLTRLNSTTLATGFSRAITELHKVHFFDDHDDDDNMVSDYDRSDGTGVLDTIESEIEACDDFWVLDDALAAMP